MNSTSDTPSEFAPTLFDTVRAALAGRPLPSLSEAVLVGPPRALAAALARQSETVLPPESDASLRQVLWSTAATNLVLLTSLSPVATGLDAAGIRWAAVKGIDHLARLYPGLEWRDMMDVDLLVHPSDLTAARRVLEGAGFSPWVGTPGVQPGMCFSKGSVSIDVHRRIVRRGGFSEDVGWLLEGTDILGVNHCPVRLMAPPQALGTAALFLAKDGFFPEMIRAERVIEVGLLADLAGADGEAEAWARLAQWGAGRVADRARDVVEWLRGGERPAWAAADFAGPDVGYGRAATPARRFLRGVVLQDSARNALGWIMTQGWSFSLQRVSGRRWGRWSRKP